MKYYDRKEYKIHLYLKFPSGRELHDLNQSPLDLCLANRGIYTDENQFQFYFDIESYWDIKEEEITYILWDLMEHYNPEKVKKLPVILTDPVYQCEMKLHTTPRVTYYQGKKGRYSQ